MEIIFLIEFCFEIIVLSVGNTCIAFAKSRGIALWILGNESTQTLYWIGTISCNSTWVDGNNNLVQYIKGRPDRKIYIMK